MNSSKAVRERFRDNRLRVQRRLAALGIAVLKICSDLGLSWPASIFIKFLEVSNVKETRVESVRNRIFGRQVSETSKSPLGDLLHISNLLPNNGTDGTGDFEALKRFRTVHIFIETKSPIPDFLAEPKYGHLNIIVYSFADQTKAIEKLGLSARTTYKPLRDRFNEISPEGVELFEYSRKLADNIYTALKNRPSSVFEGLSERQREVLTLGIDGRISARLSLAACYREGMLEVPKSDAILFLALTNTFISNGWDCFSPVMPERRSFVAFTTPKSNIRKKLIATFKHQLAKDTTSNHVKKIPIVNDAEIDKIYTHFNSSFSVLEKSSGRLIENINSKFPNGKALLIAYAESSANYKLSVKELAQEAISRNSRDKDGEVGYPILLHCSGSADQSVVPDLRLVFGEESFFPTNLSRLAPLISENMMTRQQIATLLAWLRKEIAEVTIWKDIDIFPLISNALGKFFVEQIYWSFAGYSYGHSMSNNLNIEGTLAMPSRHWLIRSVCAGVLDGSQGGRPLVDVQSLNILKHPKYRRPMANHATVIDHTAKNIYTSYFGLSNTDVSVVGAPQNDSLLRSLSELSREDILERFGIAPESQTIVLISQLQPFERMKRIVEPIGQLLKDHEGVELIIRMHPRETMERRVAYRQALQKYIERSKIHFSINDNALEVLKVADVCVTIYSNMAREAAIAGIPVITVNYLGWQPPIRLDAEGLAQPSPNPKKLKRNILASLDSDSSTDPETSSSYLLNNPHIKNGNAVSSIFSKLDDLKKKTTPIDLGVQKSMLSQEESDILSKAKDIKLIMTSDLRLADLPPIFRKDVQLTVFNSRSDPERGFLPKTAYVENGKYTKDVAQILDAAISRGNAWAQKCLDMFYDQLAEWPDVERRLKPLETSLWLRLRPAFLRQEMELANLQRGITSAQDILIVCGSNDKMMGFLCERALKTGHEKAKLLCLRIRKNLTYDLLMYDEFYEDADLRERKPPQYISRRASDKSRIAITRWLKAMGRIDFGIPKDSKLLISSDWALKTVPDTVTPVYLALAKRGYSVTFSNIRADDLPRLQDSFNPTLKQSRKPSKTSFMTPLEILKLAPDISGRNLKNLSSIIQSALFEDQEFLTAAPNIQRVIVKSVDNLTKVSLREHAMWLYYCQQYFSRNSHAVSLASPGRQWHAEIAHQMAMESGGLAMTLQNAYMTGGYTYTKPTGNYISAIDQWSKKVFMESYDVPEEQIHVTSTPRFDYLAELLKRDSNQAREALSIDADAKVVFFAAQIGLGLEAETIIREMAKITDIDGQSVIGLVKLHPRTPIADISRYERFANDENTQHKVSIHHEGNIADFLLASDIVITAYSNVGIEAAILGKPLIVAKLSDAPLPLPMDEFNIGYVAKNGREGLGVGGGSHFIVTDNYGI